MPAASGETRVSYSELALRIDTRETRGMPSPGASFETYAGTARSFGLDDSVYTHLMRWGGQGALFFPIVRPSNILSPKLVLDGLTPFDEGPIAFTELTQQGAYRGHDNRRDRVSLVGSLDYRWTLMRYLAARVFVDAAHVAPSVKDIEITNLRYAVGFGLDISDSDCSRRVASPSAVPGSTLHLFVSRTRSVTGSTANEPPPRRLPARARPPWCWRSQLGCR